MLWSSKQVKRAIHDNEFVGLVVYGPQGVGKSVYAMKTCYEVYNDWDLVLKHLYYRLDDIIDTLMDSILENKPIKCMIWDDAGVHGNKYKYFTDGGRDLAETMQELMDVIRTGVKGFIMTMPRPNEILSSARGYEWYYARVMKVNKYWRKAVIYRNNILPSGAIRPRKVAIDEYNRMLPDDVYTRYDEIRRGYFIDVLQRIKQKRMMRAGSDV